MRWRELLFICSNWNKHAQSSQLHNFVKKLRISILLKSHAHTCQVSAEGGEMWCRGTQQLPRVWKLLSWKQVAVLHLRFSGYKMRPSSLKEECGSVTIMYHITSAQLILLSLLLLFYRLSASRVWILSYLLLSDGEIVCHAILSPEC